MAGKLSSPMGPIPHSHGCPLNRTGQKYWSSASGYGRDLEENDGQVCTQGGLTWVYAVRSS